MKVHIKTCHASAETLKLLDPKLTKAQMVLVQNCQICLQAKMTNRSYNSVPTEFVASQPAQKLCVDLSFWPTPSVNGCKVLLVIADQFSKFVYSVPLKTKSAAGEAIEQFVLWVQNFCQKQVSLVHSDQGGEFMNGRLCEFYRQKGIQATFSAAYTPQQNGTVERANRTINEGVRALLLGGDMEDRFWAEAARALLYAKNLLPKIQLQGKCPYELFTGHAKPSLPEFAFGQDSLLATSSET